ncbi:MAG: methyltransferase domain-containing protein [Leptolyngbya sp. SIO1D8]|nr:methyltransferase domain-containing protein [Leptolyngbya sp. SIO1D8]
MPETLPNEWLRWICSSQNPNELRKNYDQWAATYEIDVSGVWKPVPLAAALMLSEQMSNKRGMILDVGVGTGLVGIALAELGFDDLIGIDISPGMLRQAAEKGIYRSLICCAIGDERFGNLERANSIIATGVFAETHAGSAELRALQEKIEPEGNLVFTARRSFLPKLQDVLDQPRWTLLDSKLMPIYDDPMYVLAYRICA